MNCYEHTLIAKQDLSETQHQKVVDKYESIINKNLGKIIKTEKWGLEKDNIRDSLSDVCNPNWQARDEQSKNILFPNLKEMILKALGLVLEVTGYASRFNNLIKLKLIKKTQL